MFSGRGQPPFIGQVYYASQWRAITFSQNQLFIFVKRLTQQQSSFSFCIKAKIFVFCHIGRWCHNFYA